MPSTRTSHDESRRNRQGRMSRQQFREDRDAFHQQYNNRQFAAARNDRESLIVREFDFC